MYIEKTQYTSKKDCKKIQYKNGMSKNCTIKNQKKSYNSTSEKYGKN